MNFRRWITALAVLALFAGFASAQVATSGAGGGGVFTCQANVAIPPSLRSEGLTELIGDIVITCTGGAQPAVGQPLPTANFTVSLNQNVTSRLLSYNTYTSTLAANTSEALLLIDEPGSGLPGGQWDPTANGGAGGPRVLNSPSGPATGFGPLATQYLCGAPGPGQTGTPSSAIGAGVGGCVEYAQQTAAPNSDYVMSSSATAASPAPNMFSGVVNGNQVAFYGIPIMPPASAGVARVYRITNVRLNAAALATGGYPGTQAVYASVSISSNFSLLMTNPTPIVGFLQPGLNLSAGNTGLRNVNNNNSGGAANLNQCSGYSVGATPGANAFVLRFTENFGTAFKTRVAPTTAATGQATTAQNIPGVMYNSESGFVTPLVGGFNNTGVQAGLSDYGTRLKAVFNNVPTGVTIYVTTSNVTNLFVSSGQVNFTSNTSSASFAQEVLTEGGVEGNVVTPTTFLQNSTFANMIGYAPLAATSTVGQYVAVWEVMNTNFATAENFDFGVYVTYSALVPGATTTAATVTLSYAPTASQGAFTTANGIVASSSVPIPRFTDTASTPISLFNIVLCTTNLLFPFVTNQIGFDTGIAILNTTMDPWGTTNQHGTCAFNFYGNNPPVPNPFITPDIVAGQGVSVAPPYNWAFMMSLIPGVPAAGFEGYMIAVCNFQLAHGYAFITDLGAQKLAHGYLALILTNSGKRSTTPEILEN